ncbi:MAG: hypothetical protein KF819_12450 [Labilithrix sp.]|nr:hypothetical protein [Labilithrix sp.]
MKRRGARPVEVEIATARCATCRVFTPLSEIVHAPWGTTHCLGCGVPSVVSLDLDDATERALRARPFERATRVVAGAMLCTVAFSWLAAFASQL